MIELWEHWPPPVPPGVLRAWPEPGAAAPGVPSPIANFILS
jgi:hypothetical protein